MLRASIDHAGGTIDLSGINGESDSGLPHGLELTAFAEAAVCGGTAQLAQARRRLADATSLAFVVDAAAVIANFEMMTRVADTTGAAFDERAQSATSSTRDLLGADAFPSARWG